MFPYATINDFEQAEAYRENLSAEGEAYFKGVDKFAASIQHGEPVNLAEFVKPSNMEKFWLAFSYILLACNRNISLSEDYLTVVINN